MNPGRSITAAGTRRLRRTRASGSPNATWQHGAGYFADVALDVASTRAGLAKLGAPVLLYAGDVDPMVTPAMVRRAAPLFNDATVVVQRGAGHFPWVDDPTAFAGAVGSFLRRSPG